MVTHIVIFTWNPGATEVQVNEFRQALDQLVADLSGIGVINHGPDLSFREGNGDYALVARFADKAAWDAYQDHPKHRAFVQGMVPPIAASRIAVQI